ncbi:hypothetical protein [Nocardioides solisilvae]|uniref:hypothetical protein n=1 Tax=Nocardioides solisilvae TaxID=1542435 RepID=UPI000D749837|nr:hypothetical protein [Nocardioides solisilvae]
MHPQCHAQCHAHPARPRVTRPDVSRAGRTLAGALLALATAAALTGCGSVFLSGDVEETFADMPWVVDARSECHELSCTVEVDLTASADADEVAAALEGAFDLSADDVVLTLGDRVGAEVSEHSPESAERPLAEVLAWAAAAPEVQRLTVAARVDQQHLDLVPADPGAFWAVGRSTWEATSALPARSLEVVDPERRDRHGARRLSVVGELPDGQLDRALALEELTRTGSAPALTGIAVVGHALVVGVARSSEVEAARTALRALPGDPDLPVEVVVTDDLVEVSRTDPVTRGRRGTLAATLDRMPEVGRVENGVGDLRVHLAAGVGLEAGRAVLARAREVGPAFDALDLVTADGRAEAEMTRDGDDSLLALGARLQDATPGRTRLRVSQRRDRPPFVSLSVRVGGQTSAAPPLGPWVSEMARVVAEHRGASTGYHLALEVTGPTGRSASTDWKVEAGPAGPRVTEASVLEDVAAEVRRAWDEGVRAAR